MSPFTAARLLGVGSLAVLCLAAPSPAAASAVLVRAGEPVAEIGGLQVIAQGLVTFDDGDYHWTLTTVPVDQEAMNVGTAQPSLALAGGPDPLLVSGADESAWLLGAGEALFRPADAPTEAVAVGGGTASLTVVAIESGQGVGAFAPGAGVRDVEMLRGDVPGGASVTVRAEVSALVLVTAGSIESAGVVVGVGASSVAQGDVTLSNHGPDPATVAVAVVASSVDLSGVFEIPSDETADTVAESATNEDGSTPTTAAPGPAPTTPAPGGPTTTVDPATADIDGDGLSGADEALRGTDVDDPDSDDDGLDDSFEVFESGTNPVDPDGDGDQLSDGAEIAGGTNPNLADTDGDGLNDADELAAGADPHDPDTDGDGVSDGDDNAANGASPIDADTDNDGLNDGLEMDKGTSPANPDTDGDSYGDAEEVDIGSDPLDPLDVPF
jgi:hypothetical protein